MAFPKIKVSDNSGNTVGVTDNRLNVNAYLSATPTIDIGDVSIKSGDGTAITDTVSGRLDVTLDSNSGIHAEDSAHSSGHNGILTLGVRQDNLAANELAASDGDYSSLLLSNKGCLYVDIDNSVNMLAAGGQWQQNKGILTAVVRNDALESLFAVNDGDISNLQVNSIGGLYITGSEVENAAVQSQPLLIGGRYDSSARTLGDGDAGAIALNASGHVLMDIVNGGQLDTIIDTLETTLTAIETDQAAIEVLLTGIDSDTNTMQGNLTNIGNTTYVDDDNWTDGSSRHMLVGGLYQSSMQSITDGDVGPFQVDVNGQLKVALSATDNAVLDNILTKNTEIDAVLDTIKVDTEAIETAVELLDNAISGSEMQVDVVAALPAGTNAIGKLGHDISGIQSDNNNGVDSSTAEVLKSSTACKRVDMQADPDNTGYIYVGGSDVSATKGIRLAPGDFYSIDCDNTADIYVLASVDEEDIHFTYFT